MGKPRFIIRAWGKVIYGPCQDEQCSGGSAPQLTLRTSPPSLVPRHNPLTSE